MSLYTCLLYMFPHFDQRQFHNFQFFVTWVVLFEQRNYLYRLKMNKLYCF